ncbi:hypothetical protein [Hippea sp. KM1]|uniref:hypothetical protein n=1 Tax=Hippea sp. KM1 TaxID=944481 RepID=UPI00046D408C|nr:hypothetical protein [Hippea sp. KM1]
MRKLFLFVFLVVVLSSCSLLKGIGFRSYENDYTKLLKKKTRDFVLYRDFSTIARLKVTHFDKTLFTYYIKAISYNPSDERFLPYLNEFNQYDIYYVAFYTPDLDINNLADKDSFWNVYLSACGDVLRPVSISSIDSNDWRSNWLTSVNMERWAKEYVIKFKRVSCNRKVLAFSSFLGTASVIFEGDVNKNK